MYSKPSRRAFVGLCGALATASAMPSMVSAQVLSAYQIALRIRLEGRQRMLAQRMAKATGFLMHGVREQQMIDELREARETFDDTLVGFMTGKGNSKLERERSVSVQLILREIAADWDVTKLEIDEIVASGSATRAQFDSICQHGNFLMQKADEAEKMIVEVYGDHGLPASVAKTLDFIGRQGMLTQKMAKDLILVKLGIDVEKNRADFHETVQYFDQTLLVMRTGAASYGLAVPDPATMVMLDDVAAVWDEKKHAIDAVVDGELLSKEQLADFLDQSEEILKLSVAASEQYQMSSAAA